MTDKDVKKMFLAVIGLTVVAVLVGVALVSVGIHFWGAR